MSKVLILNEMGTFDEDFVFCHKFFYQHIVPKGTINTNSFMSKSIKIKNDNLRNVLKVEKMSLRA